MKLSHFFSFYYSNNAHFVFCYVNFFPIHYKIQLLIFDSLFSRSLSDNGLFSRQFYSHPTNSSKSWKFSALHFYSYILLLYSLPTENVHIEKAISFNFVFCFLCSASRAVRFFSLRFYFKCKTTKLLSLARFLYSRWALNRFHLYTRIEFQCSIACPVVYDEQREQRVFNEKIKIVRSPSFNCSLPNVYTDWMWMFSIIILYAVATIYSILSETIV